MINRLLILCFALVLAVSVDAREIKGVSVAETINSVSGSILSLNGAGIRSKFFFSIYVAALYVDKKQNNAKALMHQPGEKQLLMHFVYDEVSKEKLQAGWSDGFHNNLSKDDFAALEKDINSFSAAFGNMKQDDTVWLNQLADKSTVVLINGEKKAHIRNPDFYPALLAIWLGSDPVASDLKDALLGFD